ncbi:MaoC family dehydratase [Stutzerimonas stutzeri]|nr:MaoC family dehydratase [Stutzerimonas stutzeri]MDH0444833.1 MaoC family dehydratase [Stutzerimonas stutzeri]
MTVSYSQTITDADIKAYAGLSGDHNPVHVSSEYAASSRFGKRIAHGLMSAGFFSALFGMRLPGPGCVYVSQSLNFKRPVYIDDTVTATVKVNSVDAAQRRVFFETLCTVGGRVVISGEAEIYIPKSKRG